MESNVLNQQQAEGSTTTSPSLRKRPLPSFIKKLWFILSDIPSQEYIYWVDNGQVICVPNVTSFSNVILPKYFKHSNWQSFVRQLNLYGFRKVYQLNLSHEEETTAKRTVWQFKHDCFTKDNPENLCEIKRRTSKPNNTQQQQQNLAIQQPSLPHTYMQKLPLTYNNNSNLLPHNDNEPESSNTNMSDLSTSTQKMVIDLSNRIEYAERKRKELLEQTVQINEIQSKQQKAIRVLMEFVVQILEKYPDSESDRMRLENLISKTLDFNNNLQQDQQEHSPRQPSPRQLSPRQPSPRQPNHLTHPPSYQQQQQEFLPSISSLINNDRIGDLPPLRKRPNQRRD